MLFRGRMGRRFLVALTPSLMLIGAACGPGEAAQVEAALDLQSGPAAAESGLVEAASVETVQAADTTWARSLSAAFRTAANRTLPSVVFVTVEREANARGNIPTPQMPDLFRRFFEMPESEVVPPPQTGSGSGFVLDSRGHVVTNHHVIADAADILVRAYDGREFEAEVVGSDPSTDLAVLRLDAGDKPLPPADFGDSDELLVGDWVLALGNPLGLEFTVTSGIVSAKGRQLTGRSTTVESFIQTDAAINPGNSGGPLIDLSGRIVGINSAIYGSSRFVGYGFAVPVNLAQSVIDDLLEFGYARRPRLGVGVSDVTAVDAEVYGLDRVQGAEVVTVDAGGPAAGQLEVGDVIVGLDDEQIEDANALIANLAQRDPGDDVALRVVREGRERNVRLELGEFDREGAGAPRVAATRGSEEVLGFRVSPLTRQLAAQFGQEEVTGLVITSVERYGSAARAGVRAGQIVRSVNGRATRSLSDFGEATESIEDGDAVSLRVLDPEIGETILNFRLRGR